MPIRDDATVTPLGDRALRIGLGEQPDAATVGSAGNSALGSRVVTAMARRRLALIWGATEPGVPNMNFTWPPVSAVKIPIFPL